MCACFVWCLCLFLLCCNLTLSARPHEQPELGPNDDDDGTPGLDSLVALAEEGGEFSQSEIPLYKKFTDFVSEHANTVAGAVKDHSKKAIVAVMQKVIHFAMHTGLVQYKIEQALGTKVTINKMDFSAFGTDDGKLVIEGIDIYNTVFTNDSQIEYHDFEDGKMKKARGSAYDFQHTYNPGCKEGKKDKNRCNLIASIGHVEITGTDFFKGVGWVKRSLKQQSEDMKTSKDRWKGPKTLNFEHLIIEDLVLYVNVRHQHTNIGCFVALKNTLTAWETEIARRTCCSKSGESDKPYCDSHPSEQASPEAQEQCRAKQEWWNGIQMDYKSVQLKNLKLKLLYPLPTSPSTASSIKMLSEWTLNNEAAAKKHITGTSMKSAAVMLKGAQNALAKMSSSALALFTLSELHEAEESAVRLALGENETLEDVNELSSEHQREPPELVGESDKSMFSAVSNMLMSPFKN
mmetsp:Transcript_74712/g.132143  ORF Transcript_74712/g.132143 Transcript_74712/m.132143 type:complete len:462 (-) Transcript_74712:28-1413(-)